MTCNHLTRIVACWIVTACSKAGKLCKLLINKTHLHVCRPGTASFHAVISRIFSVNFGPIWSRDFQLQYILALFVRNLKLINNFLWKATLITNQILIDIHLSLQFPSLHLRNQVFYHKLLCSFFSIRSQLAQVPRLWQNRRGSVLSSNLEPFAQQSHALLTVPLPF